MTLPLPKQVSALVGQVKTGYHPGLALDKHLDPPGPIEGQKAVLEGVCRGIVDQGLLDSLNHCRREALAGATGWCGRSSGPLTLHLSRATALENAGIALHPIYGFAYLPGSGLKGLARAWTERIWLELQPDRDRAVTQIRAIFGYAPNSERGKSWIPAEITRDPHGSAGRVVFHDAWPRRWPKLTVDVVGVHHPKYYQADEEREPVPPPGDWEDPNPITFLAVLPDTEFEFAVAPRRPEYADFARQAAEWLKAALAGWGAGAKTAVGYGRIVSEDLPKPIVSPQRRRFECVLELVTPAFLAGAFQREEDCDLRGATLRGQLRWWWRTMHAGHLEPRLLRRLETAIWGGAGEGGAVQIALELAEGSSPKPKPFNGRDALGYLAYGMREAHRPVKPSGSKWRLEIEARRTAFRDDPKADGPGREIPAAIVSQQARAALWLLTHHGGVGAKGRKGFGSVADVAVEGVTTLDDCRRLAADLRSELKLVSRAADRRAPSLERMRPVEISIEASDPDSAMRDIADAYRDFVKSCDKPDRAILGLPRANRRVDMGLGQAVDRHATTVHFHLAKAGVRLLLRIASFEIDRLVLGDAFFGQMEDALRRALGASDRPTHRTAEPLRGRSDQLPVTRPLSPQILDAGKPIKTWLSSRLQFNARNGTLTAIGPANERANALAPRGAELLSRLPAEMQQRIRANQFVRGVAQVRGSELIDVGAES